MPFTVISKNGTTEVLGTRFNVNTRGNTYKVFCEEGKVKVSSVLTKSDFTIKPGEMAVLYNATGMWRIETNVVDEALSWKSNKFNFNAVPLKKVFEYLEIQYDVKIFGDIGDFSDYIYTGRFNKTKLIEPTLEVICQSFNLNFTQLNSREYKIILNE
jgi:ferric-dicitrate binding protein FerR (iron transport regulator)